MHRHPPTCLLTRVPAPPPRPDPPAAVCNICRQSFMCNSTELKLREHSDSKHPKQSFADCFPSFGK